ncbi:hypothetical protein CH06BL_12060 [Chromobacterium haemolyticum]|nr:hypothetical protein CH06BL_12060 [Chromobacterium haemolyticum]
MKSALQTLLENRVSANHFDPAHVLADAEIEQLLNAATRAPSRLPFAELEVRRGAQRRGQASLAGGQLRPAESGRRSGDLYLLRHLERASRAGGVAAAVGGRGHPAAGGTRRLAARGGERSPGRRARSATRRSVPPHWRRWFCCWRRRSAAWPVARWAVSTPRRWRGSLTWPRTSCR